jgi:hypothetical protein
MKSFTQLGLCFEFNCIGLIWNTPYVSITKHFLHMSPGDHLKAAKWSMRAHTVVNGCGKLLIDIPYDLTIA